MKATARKRGRPPVTTKKNAQQDDSDDVSLLSVSYFPVLWNGWK